MHRSIDPCGPDNGFDPYDLLVHSVAPRPIAFVSTLSASGQPNLAPFSFFMAGGANPLSVCFSPCTRDDGTPKDTLRNIQETGEFVINITDAAMLEGMVRTSSQLPHGESEWPLSGFTSLDSHKVRPQRVAESPFSLECRLFQIIPHGNGPDAANYIIGEVIMIHIREDLIHEDEIQPGKVNYLARMGANYYLRADPTSMLVWQRPTSS